MPEQITEVKPENPYLDLRDKLREEATPLQRNTAETQAAHYEAILLNLMKRTGDDVDLVNSLNGFIGALDNKAAFGHSEEQIPKPAQQRLTQTLTQGLNSLNSLNMEGGSPLK